MRLAVPLAALLLAAAARAEPPGAAGAPSSPLRVEAGVRLVASTGGTRFTLSDTFETIQVSRLDYTGLTGAGAELVARAEHEAGFFAFGVLGLSDVGGGSLQDEDFVPFVDPASSTESPQRRGDGGLVQVAVGYDPWKGGTWRLGLLAGFHRSTESLHARGCLQQGANPQICVPEIPESVRVITSETTWTAPMLGLDGRAALPGRLSLSATLALLPWLRLSGADTHWLRTGPAAAGNDFYGPTPLEASFGMGLHAEATLRYRPSERLGLGVGGRLWYFDAPSGQARFDRSAYPEPGAPRVPPQAMAFRAQRASVHLEASWRF